MTTQRTYKVGAKESCLSNIQIYVQDWDIVGLWVGESEWVKRGVELLKLEVWGEGERASSYTPPTRRPLHMRWVFLPVKTRLWPSNIWSSCIGSRQIRTLLFGCRVFAWIAVTRLFPHGGQNPILTACSLSKPSLSYSSSGYSVYWAELSASC